MITWYQQIREDEFNDNDFITLAKPNYINKDGKVVRGLIVVNDKGEFLRWIAPKNDLPWNK